MRWPFSRPTAPDPPLFVLPRPIGMSAKEYEAYQLFVLAESGVGRVRLQTEDGSQTPAACLQAAGRELSVDDAMRAAPIPHVVGPGEVCRCTYAPSSAPPPAVPAARRS